MGHSRPGPGHPYYRRKKRRAGLSYRGGPVPARTAATASTRSWRPVRRRAEPSTGHGAADHLPAPAPRLVPARIRHGRLVRLLLRAIIAALLVAASPAPDAGAAVRPCRGHRPDHVVRADGARRSGPAAGPVTKMMPPAGASGSVTGATRPGRRTWLGWKACRSPRRHPGTSRADQAAPIQVVRPVGRSTWTGTARPAPLTGGTTAR